KQAEHYTSSQGVATAASGDQGGTNAVLGGGGDWIAFDPLNLEGIDAISLRAAALDDTSIELRRDAPDGELLATAELEATAVVDRVDSQEGFGSALRLNGPTSNERVNLPENVVSDLTGDFTIATWVNYAGGGEWS